MTRNETINSLAALAADLEARVNWSSVNLRGANPLNLTGTNLMRGANLSQAGQTRAKR